MPDHALDQETIIVCPLTLTQCRPTIDGGHPCDRDQHGVRIERCEVNLERGDERYVQLMDVKAMIGDVKATIITRYTDWEELL